MQPAFPPDRHLCSLGWVQDELASLSLEQIICISKCSVQQCAFSVTGRQELNAQGSSRFTRTGANAQKVHGKWHSVPLLKFSLHPRPPNLTAHFVSYSLEKCTWDAFHCILWPFPCHTGMVSARVTHTVVVSQLSACWAAPTTPSMKGMNQCHGNFKKLLNPNHQDGLY